MPTITTNYAGDVLNEIKGLLATGNETVERGLVNVIDQIRYKTAIPRIQVNNLIGPRAANPSASLGTITVDERYLTPTDAMLYQRFNPRNFESFWRPWQPEGQLVFRELPSDVQIRFLEEFVKYQRTWVGRNLWQGDTGGAAVAPYNNLVDGLVTRAKADADVIDVAGAVALTTAALTKAAFESVYDLVPAEVKNNPNFRFFASDATCELYTDAVHDQTNKGNDFTMGAPLFYKGKPIERLVGFPDNTIMATHSSADQSSNLHIGIDWDMDSINAGNEAIKVERFRPDSEQYFVRIDFKLDTQIAFGEEVVLYSV